MKVLHGTRQERHDELKVCYSVGIWAESYQKRGVVDDWCLKRGAALSIVQWDEKLRSSTIVTQLGLLMLVLS